ncbi:hypothetical protein K1T71_011831 [Dendrolimus kikuchii]|uniref:Uncharacterized protein n=1 Tax=Dendrolimus kikuchii TaxID=765133 RepID=A0ACC1CMI9_9NEOP|nr:hypothetical protein K1T71_011831 [Dendrolimus kikuchii]
MKHVAARLVPKDLNLLQKLNRIRVAEDMLERVNSDRTFMKCIITGDETWVYEYDMQTSQQASEWRVPTEPKPEKPRQILGTCLNSSCSSISRFHQTPLLPFRTCVFYYYYCL